MLFQPQISALIANLLPLAGTILAFLSIVVVHEFGHFIFCKLFNVKTPTFSIGAGPVLAKATAWDTEFRLSLLPIGGFVEIGGLAEPGQGDQTLAQDTSESSFQVKPYWQKMFILWGGIIFNLLFAFSIYTMLYSTGMPKGVLTNISVINVTEEGPAASAGLQKGDVIVGLNHKAFSSSEGTLTPAEFSKTLQASTGKPVFLSILRNNTEHLKLTITPEAEAPNAPARIKADLSPNATYTLSDGLPITESLKRSFTAISEQVTGTFAMLGSLFKAKSISGGLAGISGPVMILAQLFKTAQVGVRLLLLFVCYVNIGLATLNTLPLGALDGGQIAFATLEFIMRRRLSDTFKIWVNIISLVLFAALFIYLTFRDTLTLLGW